MTRLAVIPASTRPGRKSRMVAEWVLEIGLQHEAMLGEAKAVPTSSQVALSVFEDFSYDDPTDPTSPGRVSARSHQADALLEVLQDCIGLSRALAALRHPTSA